MQHPFVVVELFLPESFDCIFAEALEQDTGEVQGMEPCSLRLERRETAVEELLAEIELILRGINEKDGAIRPDSAFRMNRLLHELQQ